LTGRSADYAPPMPSFALLPRAERPLVFAAGAYTWKN
jgi:hypothetical protein